MQKVDPLSLLLLDSTVNHFVSHILTLPIQFSCGLLYYMKYFIIPLKGPSALVLGHNWLREANPTIDWTKGTIQTNPNHPQKRELEDILLVANTQPTKLFIDHQNNLLSISLINTIVYNWAYKAKGSTMFQLSLSNTSLLLEKTSKLEKPDIDLN